jgi:hypothetical protein
MLFAMVAVHPLNGQNLHDGTWLLGRLPNKPEIFSGGSLLDFTHRPMIARYVPVGGGSSVSYQPVSDQRGHLLFYTNGCAIYNQFHTLVENGDGLNPGWYRDRYCDESKLGYVVDQGLAFIPKTDTNQYILYHTLVADTGGFPLVYQTEIERTEDGTGRVTKKNDPVLHGYLDGGLVPVRHGNGRDWWIAVILQIIGVPGSSVTLLLSTPEGTRNVNTQRLGGRYGSTQTLFSPDGRYFCYHTGVSMWVYDFDRCRGTFSNQRTWQAFPGPIPLQVGGAAISPNSKYLYVSSGTALYQYDLEAADIKASEITVYDAQQPDTPVRSSLYKMQLAPDGKIYVMPIAQTRLLHIIQKPDERGKACQFEVNALQLPTENWIYMPSFPNYRLGALPGPCDTLQQPPAEGVSLAPNPTNDYVKVGVADPEGSPVFELYDALGRLVFSQSLLTHYTHLPVGFLPSAVYFYRVKNADGKRAGSGKLVIRH